MIFVLKAKLRDRPSVIEALDSAKRMIASGDAAGALALVEKTASDNKMLVPPYVDVSNEIRPASFGSPENEKARLGLKRFFGIENIANFAKVSSSSEESETKSAKFANDGRIETRWASVAEDNQWIRLDFGRSVRAGEAAMLWEDAFASDYAVTISSEGGNVEVFRTDKGGKGLVSFKLPDIPFTSLAVNCGRRGTGWGFSIREIGLFGKDAPVPDGFSAVWRSIPAPGEWKKDDALEWRDGGFGISPSAERSYGCVEMTKKLPVNELATTRFELDKTVDCSVTLQLQLFNATGEFIGALDLAKDLTGPASELVKLGSLKLDKSVESVNFKIWIGSSGKGYAEFREISYCH
jgi:hypothetical protein